MEGDLRDEQWELIAPLLPTHKKRGRPRADDRRTLNGIPSASSGQALWVLRSGARWKDLPKEYGSRSTCHRRLQEWQEQGVWERIWLTFLGTLDQLGKLDWSQAFLDGNLVPAKKGTGHRPWPGKGSTVYLLTEGNGLPLAFLVTAANVDEVTVGLKVVDRVRVPRPQGRPKQRPASLGADKSYDSADFRHGLRRRGIQPSIPRREWPSRRRKPGRPPEIHETSKGRWKVEQSHGWLDNYRRLVTRYDWYTQSYVAFLAIACFMTALSRIME